MDQSLTLVAEGLDTAPLLVALGEAPELWEMEKRRQTTPGSPHKDTRAILLRWCESQTVEAVFGEIPAVDYPALEKLPSARPLIGEVLHQLGAKELGRVMLAELRPRGVISPHVDEGAYADHYERFHVPLYSELSNLFYVSDGVYHGSFAHMLPGSLWWFNHKRHHWAENRSSEPRVHLIVDCVASRFRRERE